MDRQDYGGFDRYFNQMFQAHGRTYDFVLTREVDFTLAQSVIAAWEAVGARVTLGAVMCRAVAWGLDRHPWLARWPVGRSSYGETPITLGVPIDAPGVSRIYGVPAGITDAYTMSLPALTAELARLAATARAGQAAPFNRIAALPAWTPIELATAFFGLAMRLSTRLALRTLGVPVLSIVRGADALYLTRGIGPCAFAFGEVQPRAVVHGGALAVAPVATFVCAFDHRVASAMAAVAFIETVRRAIEVELAEAGPASVAPGPLADTAALS